MPVNLINEKALNEYLTDIVYHGQEMETFTKGEFNSPAYVRQNKEAIVRSMVMQWMKHRLRSYLIEEKAETKDFLQAVKQDEENLPGWAERCLAEGKPVHRFIVDKIPARLSAEIGEIRDYLHSAADSYVNKTLDKAEETEGKPRLRIDYLKSSNEWDSYEKTLHAAEKWHELLAKKAEKKAHDEKMYRESLAGTKSVMKLSEGMEIVQLTTEKALDFESEYMGHCVGQGSYDEEVRDGTIKIYSLRDENGEPHATFEVRVNKKTKKEEIYQCKGKGNKAPVEKYRGYVQAFVKAKKFEIKRDMANVGLIKQYDKETKEEKYYDIYHLPKGFVVKGDLDFSGQDITELPDLSEVIVKGNFECTSCPQLESLAGAPKKVGGSFCCSFCGQLMSLAGAPEEVGGYFSCVQCPQLTSLKGAPKEVGRYFICSFCGQLMSLEGAPKVVKGYFDCRECPQLTSLAGAPKEVGGSFYCYGCPQLESIEWAPKEVGGYFYCDEDIATKYGIKKKENDYSIVKEAIKKKHNSEKVAKIRGKLQESKKVPKNVRDDKGKKTSQRKNDYSRE